MIGATGQIGSEITLELRRRYGKDNVVASWHKKGLSEQLESGPVEHLDATDCQSIKKILSEYSIDTVYHLAAILSAVGEKNPQLAWNVNMSSLYNVLEASREKGGMKVFWPSSIAVFGRGAPRFNTPQDAVLIPSTIYGVTKASGELLCNYYATRFNLDVRSVRYPGIISSETMPGGGTTDYAVEIFYEAIKNKRYSCFVRKDTVLPMMYMPDCTKAAVQIMEADPSDIHCRMAYNVTAMSFSAEELAAEIKKHIKGFEVDYEPDFRQMIADSWPMSLDDDLAREHWGWKPDFNLTTIVVDMIAKLKRKLRA